MFTDAIYIYQPTLFLFSLLQQYTSVNCGHLKKFLLLPDFKKLVEYSYLLPKYSVKILREEKIWRFLFISLFVKGAFYM